MFVNVSAGFIECRFTDPHCNQLYVDVHYYEKNGRNDAIARITASVDNIYNVFNYQMDLHKKDMKPPLPSSPLAKVRNGFYNGVRGTGTCINIQHMQLY